MPKTVMDLVTEARAEIENLSAVDTSNEIASGEAILVDVREPLEWEHHIEGAFQIPRGLLEFVADVQEHFTPDDTILTMCRSGGRSAWAVNMLAEADFEEVYSIIDGMEGDKVKDPGSVFHGKRMMNGWKNAGLPWTYDLDPELVWHPHEDHIEEVRTALDL